MLVFDAQWKISTISLFGIFFAAVGSRPHERKASDPQLFTTASLSPMADVHYLSVVAARSQVVDGVWLPVRMRKQARSTAAR